MEKRERVLFVTKSFMKYFDEAMEYLKNKQKRQS